MKNKMRIVHLSDYHIDRSSANESQIITNKLIDVLEQINRESKIDVIIFSGDLINKGGASYETIARAFLAFEMILIDKLLKKLDMTRNQFFFTIGNHDIDRNADSRYVEQGLSLELNSIDTINDFYNLDKTEGIQRVLPFKDFEKKFYSKSFKEDEFYQSNFESCYIREIDGKKIGIACLNSVWRCYDSEKDKGKILFAERQISKSAEFLKKCDIKIAVSHHHYEWVADFERTIIAKSLNTNFDIYFCGHTHSSDAEFCVKPSGKMFTFVAPGVLSKNRLNTHSEYKNGFSVVDYDIDNGKAISVFYVQEYSSDFKVNTMLGDNGRWEVEIPLGEEALRRLQMQQIVLGIKDELAYLNKHLLSYNTSSNAPKSLNEIFVMPDIAKCYYAHDKEGNTDEEFIEDEEVVQVKNLTDLISVKENIVIFGIKESGKTVLLDKILYDILNVQGKLCYIPVLFDFSKLKSGVKKNIQEFWKKNKKEIDEILDKENIVLLIDDMKFDSESQEELITLNKFLKSYPNVRFIGTSLNMHEHDLVLDQEMTSYLKFDRYELKQFKAKQIKCLTKKWFPDSPNIETPRKLETLINAFFSLNLPRTPFAVSMFLWIIERQNAYRPQNCATLIEKFIEETLDKKNITGVLRETFDYENKIRLLSEIAYKMLKTDNYNYSLLYSEIVQKAEEHFRLRKFTGLYKPRKIIDDFLSLGVLIEDNDGVRFRFNCFFEYFLAKKMEYSFEFRSEVLSEDFYLKYCNEIQYYTGLHRGEKDILKTIINRLEYSYIDITDVINKKVRSVDDFFNVDISLIQNIKAEELFDLLPEKKTEEDENEENDKKLERTTSSQDGIMKKKNTNKFNAYGQLLILAMNVLKNSEEIDEQNLKNDSYVKVLRNSISYCILYKLICNAFIKHENKFPKERITEFKYILRFLPLMHQTLLSDNIGTYKLSEVIKDKIQLDKAEEVSEFEKFLSVFLYADIKGKDFKDILSNFVKTLNKKYVIDSSFFKLMSYYYNSKNQNDDRTYLNLMVDLYIRLNASIDPSKRINKNRIMEDYKRRKLELDREYKNINK